MLRLRGWRALVLLFLLSLPAVTTRIYASDEIQYFSFLRSLWFDHDLDFANEYRYFEDHYFHDRGVSPPSGFGETYLSGEASRTETGYRKTYATIGCALLWAPFYAAGDATARLLHAMGRPVAVDGYSQPYVAAVCYGSACYGFAALLLSAAIVRRLLGSATAAALAVWLGTPLLFYMYLAPAFAHACEAFAVALLLWSWLHARERWTPGRAALLGAAGALAAMVREQELVFVAGPALDFAWTALQSLRARRAGDLAPRTFTQLAGAAAAGVAGFALAYVPQVIAYLSINGHLSASGDVKRKMSWSTPHFFQVLFDTGHGLVFWTPLVCLALAGLLWLLAGGGASGAMQRRERQTVGACSLALVLLNTYIAGSLESWTAAGAFGQRRFVSLTPVLVIGMAALLTAIARRGETWRWTVRGLIVLCVWWNLGLTAQFGMNRMDRQQLNLPDNARMTFFTLPFEAPQLLWRYVWDRSSFYNQPRR
jgi:hypothetical protein